MKYICALIVVEDIQKSRRFYETVLGQKIKTDYGENISFYGDFAIHQRSHFQKVTSGKVKPGKNNRCELYFEEDEIESLMPRLRKEGIEFLHDIMEQPWRQRVIRFYDYDENLIEVGETMTSVARRLSLEGLDIKEICRITYLPEEIVRNHLK